MTGGACRGVRAPGGVDQLAVGTADGAVRLLEHFPHDIVLLEPFLPATPRVELPDRVVRNAASVEAVRESAGHRMVIDCRSSLRRQGVAKSELGRVREALGGARPEG